MIILSTTFKYINHACFMLSHEGHNIIFDPYLESCPKFKEGDMEALKGLNVEYILVSHAHFDHIGSAFDIAKACDATIISTAEVAGLAGETAARRTACTLAARISLTSAMYALCPPSTAAALRAAMPAALL